MTEDESKTKDCPILSGFVSAGVEGEVIMMWQKCIASECMWWVPETASYLSTVEKRDGYEWDEEEHIWFKFINCGHCGAIK